MVCQGTGEFQASLIPVLPGRAGNSLPACDMLAVKFDFS